MYLLGMDKIQEQGLSPSSSSSSISASLDDPALKAALKKIEELEHENRLLQNRIDEQERQEHSRVLATTLDAQVSRLLCSDLSVFHGPDTIEHFNDFSVDAALAEIRNHAPAVVELLDTMGQSNRHERSELSQLSQLRVMTSLTSLLKCRSVQVLGIQLLITFMLIARSTNKQVTFFYLTILILVFFF